MDGRIRSAVETFLICLSCVGGRCASSTEQQELQLLRLYSKAEQLEKLSPLQRHRDAKERLITPRASADLHEKATPLLHLHVPRSELGTCGD